MFSDNALARTHYRRWQQRAQPMGSAIDLSGGLGFAGRRRGEGDCVHEGTLFQTRARDLIREWSNGPGYSRMTTDLKLVEVVDCPRNGNDWDFWILSLTSYVNLCLF